MAGYARRSNSRGHAGVKLDVDALYCPRYKGDTRQGDYEMTATFERNGKTFTGQVVSRGFYNVDAPECFEVELSQYRTVMIPVTECAVA
jgi:hypothetical protein